jgi:hypothetical protein
MIRMVNQANEQIAAGVAAAGTKPAAQVQKVTCATCHRGSAVPMVPEYQPPAPAGRAGGAPAGGAAPTPGR